MKFTWEDGLWWPAIEDCVFFNMIFCVYIDSQNITIKFTFICIGRCIYMDICKCMFLHTYLYTFIQICIFMYNRICANMYLNMDILSPR